jgi:ankyrin repeat protein
MYGTSEAGAMPTHLDLIVNRHRELNEAARVGDLARLRGLLASGAGANATNACGSTVLHAAAAWSNRAVAEILIGHGADLHARDWEGDTPLHIAAAFGDKPILGFLLDRGADIHARDDVGWTPLHVAARVGRVDEAAFLLSRGADAGARDEQGRTPLDVALWNCLLRHRWETLTRLLGNGKHQAKARHSVSLPADLAARNGSRVPAPTGGHSPRHKP